MSVNGCPLPNNVNFHLANWPISQNVRNLTSEDADLLKEEEKTRHISAPTFFFAASD